MLSFLVVETGWSSRHILWELSLSTLQKLCDGISVQRHGFKGAVYNEKMGDGEINLRYLKALDKRYNVQISDLFRMG